LSSEEKILATAFFLNTTPKFFKARREDLKSLFQVLLGASSVLNGRVRELIEKAWRITEENPQLFEEITTRIELGAISPYAADYLASNDARRVYLKAEIGEFYKTHGVKVRGEMPDHIAPMLELLSLLLIKKLYLEGKGDTTGATRCKEDFEKLYKNYVKPLIENMKANLGSETPHSLILEAASLAIETLYTPSF